MRSGFWDYLWQLIRPHAWLLLIGILLTIPVGAMEAAIAAFFRPYVDHVILGMDTLVSALIPVLIVAFTGLQSALTFLTSHINALVGNRAAAAVKRQLFHKLLTMDAAFFDGMDTGKIFMRFGHDADVALTNLINNGKFFLIRFFSSAGLAGVLIYNSPALAAIALLVGAIAFFPLRMVRKKIRTMTTKNEYSGAAATVFYNETALGNRTLIAYGLQQYQETRFNQLMDDMLCVSTRVSSHSNWISPAMHFIVSIGLALVLAFGGWLVSSGHMTGGSFVSFIAALLLLYTPFKGIGNNLTAIQGALLAIERIQEIMAFAPKIPNILVESAKSLKIASEIRFRNVHFAYRPKQPVLSGINFTIPAGKTVGIVGNSGTGKSSLVHLLARVYDVTGGSIEIDGVDIRKISLVDLRRSMALVFQDSFLFSGTIRENILLGNLNASEEALQRAICAAYLQEFIETLPDQLDTQVGERGMLLSGGQKQRIAIARAILRDAPIVILDEATSALDNQSEAIVQKALDNLMRHKTVLIVAHRLSTIGKADFIVALDGGQIVESGTEDELLRMPNGIYAQFHRAQFTAKKKQLRCESQK
ncbi:MAG: ABC transporter ATP-binding protein/permease [Puniceicoccales bacterium]|jgi:subfamily B ATP-binding cassette protein MsbA|nr:ABC transporter ATP-binding protein/permease [Puniceicoccales bacterium]